MRTYHVVAINEKTGYTEYLTATPVTHREGCIIIRKLHPRPRGAAWCVRIQLEEVIYG